MRLSAFIKSHREAILVEWEAFARTCGPASDVMNIESLRDHASEMLTVIAKDLDTSQGDEAQDAKSKGNAPATPASATTAAEDHGADRAESGFSVAQMISEYRALRASVIRLWTEAKGEALDNSDVEDLTRFNEAIDQSLAESIGRYTEDLHHSKEMFLAMLGHDMRTPLGAVLTSAQFMLDTGELGEPHLTLTTRIAASASRMVHMVGDLLDFTRTRLGGGIPVTRSSLALGELTREVIDEVSAAYPLREIDLEIVDEQQGDWDGARVSQALTNLVGNALQHGAPGSAITVCVDGDVREATVTVHNFGTAIPADLLNGIFNPMKVRASSPHTQAGGPGGNLGLGLYIAERIVNAHQGRIDVDSSETKGTTFTMRLPKRAVV